MMTAIDSERRVALVTGAAGGFGGALARGLSGQGFDLVLTDRTAIAADLTLGSGCKVLRQTCDLTDSRAIADLCHAALEHFGRVDVVVNNAADQRLCRFSELSLEQFRQVQAVNVEAPLLLAQSLLPGMVDRRWGRIIGIASRTPWQPSPGFSAYITSKMALVGLMRALAHEYGEWGITANAVCPGLTEHDGNRDALPRAFHERAQSRQAIKRPPTPEDVAGPVCFLASNAGGFVTGQTISADGGSMIL